MARLQLNNLVKQFANFTAVNGISLDIGHGEFVCLLGPSGCGKTTTLRLVAGFLDTDGGEIRVGDRVVSAPGRTVPPERRNMSMIFQSYAVWPHMTVRENVGYGLRMRRVPKAEAAKKIDHLLAATELDTLGDRYPSELSGGQQQRVSLARALAPDPEILLLDEPLSNLDANLRESMRFEIRRLHNTFHYTTIYVTHDQTEAMALADRIVVMNAGNIEQVGAPEDIYERPASVFVARFIGGTNIISGTYRGDGVLDTGNYQLQMGQGDLPEPGTESFVSVRGHHLQLSQDGDASAPNTAPGRVIDQAYMGQTRDYLIDVYGQTLEVSTLPTQNIPPGSEILVQFPVTNCRSLIR